MRYAFYRCLMRVPSGVINAYRRTIASDEREVHFEMQLDPVQIRITTLHLSHPYQRARSPKPITSGASPLTSSYRATSYHDCEMPRRLHLNPTVLL